MTVVIMTKLVIKPECTDDAMALFKEMVDDVAANEPGTTGYQFYRDENRPNTYWAYEQFADAAARDTHLSRHHHRVEQFNSVMQVDAVMNRLETLEL